VQAIVRDVTPRWQRESARILADRVATSTALAAGVAHAINNPLAYILINLDYVRGFLDQLGQLDDSELVEAREALQEAREGAQQVSHIVQALRVFSSEGEEGQWATDLRAVVDSVADLALGAIRQRARLVKVLDPIPLVRGRAASLGQLVLGLVLELVRRLPDEEPRDVEIRLVTRALAGAVVLEVSLGSGAEERAPADGAAPARTRADTDPAGWSPLGIALCRAIACEAGGALTLDGGGDGPAAVRVQLRPALTPVAPA
jgi:C4-dicarboxylate-specific signal transduction histidine kinase